MKIRVVICTEDAEYSSRVVRYFQAHYYDKFTWNGFDDFNDLVNYLKVNGADVVLIGKELQESFDISAVEDGGQWVCAYMVDDIDDELAGIYQIEKYSRADKLYRDLLMIYSHKSNISYRNTAIDNNAVKVYTVVSAAGGVGASTIACAMAQSCAEYEKVLYINLENEGAVKQIYDNGNEIGFDEIIFALKSRRKALELKISSAVSRDNKGVYFFDVCKNALDIFELTNDDLKELILTIQQMREYDKVILDVGNGLGEKEIAAMTYAGRVILVTEDKEIANQKLDRYITALQTIEEQKKTDICSKMLIFYNIFSKQKALPGQLRDIRVAGSFPKFENGSYREIVDRISEMEAIHGIE